MIEIYDSKDMAFLGGSLVKEDFFNYWIKKNKIDKKKYTFVFIDDKLGLLKIGNKLKKQRIKAINFWRNNNEIIKYDKKYYDFEITNLNQVLEKIKNKKKIIVFSDFDNTLCRSNYEFSRNKNKKENHFWENIKKKWYFIILSKIASFFPELIILIDKIKPSNEKFLETNNFLNYFEIKNIKLVVVSYRSKTLQKKYLKI